MRLGLGRGPGPLRLKVVDASGRRRLLRVRGLVGRAAAAALGLAACGALASAYTPTLHVLAGDETTRVYYGAEVLAGKALADHRAALINVLLARETPAASDLPTVHLVADPARFAALDHEILRFGLGDLASKPKVPGHLVTDSGRTVTARIGYRGTNSWHHQYWKPSLQLRLDDPVAGFRRHDLIAPEDGTGLRNWLSQELAGRFGVLANGEHFVRVFLNGRFLGVYTRVWPLDDDLLVARGLPPGPFFRAEDGTGPVFDRRAVSFADPSTWEVEGVERAEGEALLARLLAAPDRYQEDAVAGVRAIGRLVDRDAFARYLAVLCHAGEVHVDRHNFALWFDRSRGRFVPVPVDVNGYGLYDLPMPGRTHERPIQRAGNSLIATWLVDPRNLAAYVERLDELVRGPGSAEAVEGLVREAWARAEPDARADLQASDMGHRTRVYARTRLAVTDLADDVEALVAFVRRRVAWVEAQLATLRVTVVGVDADDFEVLVHGLAGARAERAGGPARELLPTVSPTTQAVYAIHRLPGRPADYRFTHRLSGRPVAAGRLGGGGVGPLRAHHGIPPAALAPPTAPLRLSGEVELTEDLVVEADAAAGVVIAPGTTLRLGEGVALVARGVPLTARGTAAAPIRIEGLPGNARPWGSVAVQGAAADLAHVVVRGGSRAEVGGVLYEGALAVHHGAARLEGCAFEDAAVGGYAAHVTARGCAVRGPQRRLVFARRSAVEVVGLERRGPEPVHEARLREGPVVGTPPRTERELKLALTTPAAARRPEDLARAVRAALAARVGDGGWAAPGRDGVFGGYFPDDEAEEMAFVDVYLDDPRGRAEAHAI